MYLPLTLIPLSTVTWPTSLPVLDNRQTAVTVTTTTPTPTPAIESFEKRQPAYAPVDTREPVYEAVPGDAAEDLEKRQHSTRTYTEFDQILNILCPTLKALKSENPSSFTNLLQSCTSLEDSSSNQKKRAFRERNVNEENEKRVADANVKVDGSGKAFMGRSHENLPEKRALDGDNLKKKSAKLKSTTRFFAPL